ncbi:MAG: DUF559 domain-containing protein [Alphaproteobacteria bacterium]
MPTASERLLWNRLSRRQLGGLKFRRQHQVGLYICDFVSISAKVIVELDGSQHADQMPTTPDATISRGRRASGSCDSGTAKC